MLTAKPAFHEFPLIKPTETHMTPFHHNTRAAATRTPRRLLLAAALAVAATPWVSAFAQAPAAT